MSISDKLTTVAENQVKIFDAGYSRGKREQDETIWNCITNYGKREKFPYTFSYTDFSGYRFIKPISPSGKSSSAANMFKFYTGIRLPENLDLSNISITSTHADMFFEAKIVEMNDIKIPALNSYHNMFLRCTSLKTIKTLRVHTKTTFFQTFYGCSALEQIRFEGTIGNDIDLSDCKNLTVETLLHIIDHLNDYSDTDTICTLTMGSSNLDKLTDSQQQKVLDKGWVLV